MSASSRPPVIINGAGRPCAATTASRTAQDGPHSRRNCWTAIASKCGTTAVWASCEAHRNRPRKAARAPWDRTPEAGALRGCGQLVWRFLRGAGVRTSAISSATVPVARRSAA